MEFSEFKGEFKHIIKTEIDPSDSNKQSYVPLIPCKREPDVFYPHFLSKDRVETMDLGKLQYNNKDKYEYTYSLKMDVKNECYSKTHCTKHIDKDKEVFHAFRCDLCNLLLLEKSNLSIHCKSHVEQSEMQMTTCTRGQYTSTLSNDINYISLLFQTKQWYKV